MYISYFRKILNKFYLCVCRQGHLLLENLSDSIAKLESITPIETIDIENGCFQFELRVQSSRRNPIQLIYETKNNEDRLNEKKVAWHQDHFPVNEWQTVQVPLQLEKNQKVTFRFEFQNHRMRIRNLVISRNSCTDAMCNFESNACEFQDRSTSDFKFIVMKGNKQVPLKYPIYDATFNGKVNGHYLTTSTTKLLKNSSPKPAIYHLSSRKNGLRSKMNAIRQDCLQFDFYQPDTPADILEIWSITGSKIDHQNLIWTSRSHRFSSIVNWNRIHITVRGMDYSSLELRAIRLNVQSGPIAIDNIVLSANKQCPKFGLKCMFDTDFCDFQPLDSDVTFKIGLAQLFNANLLSRPLPDSILESNPKNMLYADFTELEQELKSFDGQWDSFNRQNPPEGHGRKMRLLSNPIPFQSRPCTMTANVFLAASDSAKFELAFYLLKEEDEDHHHHHHARDSFHMIPVFSLGESTNDAWMAIKFNFKSRTPLQLMIEAQISEGEQIPFIAIRDLKLNVESEWIQEEDSTLLQDMSCSFEQDLCGWRNLNEFNFERNQSFNLFPNKKAIFHGKVLICRCLLISLLIRFFTSIIIDIFPTYI